MNILETIIEKKKIEITERKRSKSIAELEQQTSFKREAAEFKNFLLRKKLTS